ncbi:uncharacterized protein LOC117141813 [Drosophila mauritiana]|uniref:Uncharacterized protein LOC117141813 n=1 Tax=Drosophila mauritiana TaxID=7226 RepID=A0A6P8JWU8_DROMA|nr:uncharacterized protein LOC117141813 [Drosophila mauritiana]
MSEIEWCAEVDELDSEESGQERTPSIAPEDLNDNAILASPSDSGTDTDLLSSLSLSTTTVDGSQSSGTEESNLDLDTGHFGLRPVQGTTNLRPHSTLTSSPSGPQLALSSPWQVIRRRLRSHREVINRPSGRFERRGRLSTSETVEMIRLISEFMQDLVNSRPSLEVQRGRNRMRRAEGIARPHARSRLDAQRVRAASLHRTALRAAEQLISAPNDQELRRANSVSDCSQCSSDEEQDQIDGKNRKPTVPSHLTEWLYPI